MASLNTIKSWFKTGLKPTQAQFWTTWDSFWHKDEMIPINKIESLDERFDEKADAEALTSHMNDLTAHGLGNLPRLLKTTLTVNEDFSIQWQTDIVPGDGRTYAVKHGNSVPNINGAYDQDGVMMGYKPGFNFIYTIDTGLIITLNITEVFTGIITIS